VLLALLPGLYQYPRAITSSIDSQYQEIVSSGGMIFCRTHGWHLIVFRLEHLLTPDYTEEHFVSFRNIYNIYT
jgi:hypothetical protein